MYSLYYLDTMLTGGDTRYDMRIKDDDVFILRHLMNKVLNKKEKKEPTKKFDDYLYQTFDAFIQNKTHIVLDLYYLYDTKDRRIISLLMNNILKRGRRESSSLSDKDMNNLFKVEIFEIFKNIQNIIIVDVDGEYSFSMFALLSVIELSGVQQITIKVYKED